MKRGKHMSVSTELLTEDRIRSFEQVTIPMWAAHQNVYAGWVVPQLQACQSYDEKRDIINACLDKVRYEHPQLRLGRGEPHAQELPEWVAWKAVVEDWRRSEGLG